MAFSSICRKASGVYDISCIHHCLQSVRRNASVLVCAAQRHLFSSKTSARSSFELPNRDPSIKRRTPISLKALLMDYGFSDIQIHKLAKKLPLLLKLSIKNIEPKLKFFGSIGVSSVELASLISRDPFVLTSSLQKKIVPSYNYLKNVPLTDKQIVRIARSCPGIFMINVDKVLVPNIELLRNMGLPLSSITYLVVLYSGTLCRNHETFKTSVDKAVAMGQNPSKISFVGAVHVFCSLTEEKWDRKLNLYRTFGLSEDLFTHAFRVHPSIMAQSEKNIAKKMGFFVNERRLDPGILARTPVVLSYDLERRVIPRFLVMDMLKERGLVTKYSAAAFLKYSEKEFLDRFVNRYKDGFPELEDTYNRSFKCPQGRSG